MPMKKVLNFVPVHDDNSSIYIKTGTRSYNQHYAHLWAKGDTSPYLESSFTPEVVKKELADSNSAHFIIRNGGETAGILKIVKNKPVAHYPGEDALLLEKLYLLSECSGKGLGSSTLIFVQDYAKNLNKKVMWLDAMKNARALRFYVNHGFIIYSERLHWSPLVLEAERPMYIMIKKLEI